MNERVDRLRARLEEPLLVTGETNVFYLCGFRSSNAALLVEPERLRLYADFRYAEAAQAVEGVEFVETKRSLLGDLGERLEGPIGFDAGQVTHAGWQALTAAGLEAVPRTGLVEAVRAVKSEDELAAIGRASRAAEHALEALVREPWIGRSEREVAWRFRELAHANGADEMSFETIVASGPNGARPHARPTERTIGRGELVVCDFGVVLDGYCSDCTRTFSTGDLPEELRRAYEACREAQLAAVEGIRAGMSGVEADALARDPIETAGYGERFGHGLGHGVGLAVHEAPTLSRLSTDTLEAGNVVTIEPGIYLPGVGGVRIEDLAVVREDGLELMTSFRKDLVEVE
ncbi:MAG TPA: aminopeptidase P family protein [Gaiellaceae bacterium]|nr:aminopeptidase P family protein [Gaiellaceae bacterium]